MIYLAWFILALAVINFTVSLVNLLSAQYLPAGAPDHTPLVSILIPARNEEKNIRNILSDLLKVPYPELEILVYNDDSGDRTEEVVKEFMGRDQRIRLLSAHALPEGWTGKNHACHQLARQASGAYYLFLDADVRIREHLVDRALDFLIKHDLALLSIFPVQSMQTLGAKISVPLMNWILLSLLPMPLIRRNKRPSLAAANGQFMLFPARVYDHWHPHSVFRNHPVEDVVIIRFLKKQGLRVETFLGRDDISCRMYDDLGTAIEGFSKNIFLFFGNSMALTFLYALLITLAPVFIILYLPVYAWIVYAGLILMMRINVSWASRQPVFQNLLYLVPQQIVLLLIIGKAFYHRLSGKLEWKGRNVLATS
jgi:glycosyltransferase involved in cell wall biosynthesis